MKRDQDEPVHDHEDGCGDCAIEFNYIQERIMLALNAGGVGMNDHTASVLLALAVWNLQTLGRSEASINGAVEWSFRVARRRKATGGVH